MIGPLQIKSRPTEAHTARRSYVRCQEMKKWFQSYSMYLLVLRVIKHQPHNQSRKSRRIFILQYYARPKSLAVGQASEVVRTSEERVRMEWIVLCRYIFILLLRYSYDNRLPKIRLGMIGVGSTVRSMMGRGGEDDGRFRLLQKPPPYSLLFIIIVTCCQKGSGSVIIDLWLVCHAQFWIYQQEILHEIRR